MDFFEKITKFAEIIMDVTIIAADSHTPVILRCAKNIIKFAEEGHAHLMNAKPSSPNRPPATTATSSGNAEIVTMNTALAPRPLSETTKNNAIFADPLLKEIIRKCLKEEQQDLKLIPPKPMPSQVSPEDKLPYTLIVEKKDPNDTNIKDLWYLEYTFNKTDYAPLCERQLTTDELRIDFETIHQRRRVFREILEAQTLEKKFKCLEANRIVPLVVVRGFSYEYKNPAKLRDLINSKVTDKNYLEEEAVLSVESITTDKCNSNYYMALLAVNLRGWHALIALGKLGIGNRTCTVEDYVAVDQCNFCLQYGHSGRDCTKNVTICSYCASNDHTCGYCKVKDDYAKRCCYNCKTKPLMHFGFKPPDKHSPTSSYCPHWELARERVRILTNNDVKPVLYRPKVV